MHSMVKSAADERRERTARAITRCARDLTAQHGLDGFTMDQLAQCAGVSRRTLFNYVPGKVDAVLGGEREPEDEPRLLATFLAGGPTGVLLADVKELVRTALEDEAVDPAEIDEVRRLLRSDPRLYAAVHERFAEKVELFSEAITQREGEAVDPLVLQLLGAVVLGAFDIALDESLADSARTFAEHFDHVFDVLYALFETRPA